MSYSELLYKEAIRPFLLEMRIGLEKESQRVDLAGNLAKSDHPKTLGSRTFHPYIQYVSLLFRWTDAPLFWSNTGTLIKSNGKQVSNG